MESKQQMEIGQSKQKQIIDKIIEMLPREPRSYDTVNNPGFWANGTEILCPSETECEAVAEFLRDILSKYGNMVIQTGWYDPFEDARNGEQDERTGFCYISFE